MRASRSFAATSVSYLALILWALFALSVSLWLIGARGWPPIQLALLVVFPLTCVVVWILDPLDVRATRARHARLRELRPDPPGYRPNAAALNRLQDELAAVIDTSFIDGVPPLRDRCDFCGRGIPEDAGKRTSRSCANCGAAFPEHVIDRLDSAGTAATFYPGAMHYLHPLKTVPLEHGTR